MIDRMTQILGDLIRFESISSNSNLDIINYIEEIFRTNSILARRVLSPDGQKSSLLATIGPADRPGVQPCQRRGYARSAHFRPMNTRRLRQS
jgi:acetylornithine deacetylase